MSNRKKILVLLESIPDQSAVVLVEHEPLQTPRDKRDGKLHWLQKWATSMGGKVFAREYSVPHLSGWIVKRANKMGGEIEPKAAEQIG